MRVRKTLMSQFAVVQLMVILAALGGRGVAQSGWRIEKTFHVGGEGGWDYITFDPNTHLLYVPRSTHTMVVDAESGTMVADIAGQKHNHGVAVAPEAGRGFITDGNGAIIVFDLKTNGVLGTLAAKPDADGIIFDKGSGLVLVAAGDSKALLTVKPDVDPKTGSMDPPIELGGSPEFLAADGAGKAYINLEDKNEVAVVDLKSRKVVARWPVAPGGSPVGMSIDTKARRLFIGCRNPQKLIVMSADNGKVLADMPICAGVDATRFDGNHAFASCRDGKLDIAAENAAGKFEILQTVETPGGAKTMDIDVKADKLYLPTAEFEPPKAGERRPTPKPGTFMIVVVARR